MTQNNTPPAGFPWATRPPVLLEGGTGPGVSPDQTRERPDILPPALAVVPSVHLDGCSADEDPDGETMCVCDSIEREQAAYDPREDEECTPEQIDGQIVGCGVCEACLNSEVDEA